MKIFNNLKKFWNKLFTKEVVNYPTDSLPISPAVILKVLKRAKEIYIHQKYEVGMCYCIYISLSEILYDPFNDYKCLNKYIPEFNPKFLKGDSTSVYWWPLNDSKSRIKAFDKLISIYENKNSQ